MRRATVIARHEPERIGDAIERVEAVARVAGVDLSGPQPEADVAVVLGGDGTILNALNRFLDTGVPAIGVNFGRVGFLASIRPDELEAGLARVFAGDFVVQELPTVSVETAAGRALAVNDVVVASATLGRMVTIDWAVGGEEIGSMSCDGVVLATPSGSTAYNLSNGGPVLVWGIDALVVTFVAPHSLHARPLVIPRGSSVEIRNRTAHGDLTVVADGHPVADVPPDGVVRVCFDDRRSLLASLPEVTFFRRYHDTFGAP